MCEMSFHVCVCQLFFVFVCLYLFRIGSCCLTYMPVFQTCCWLICIYSLCMSLCGTMWVSTLQSTLKMCQPVKAHSKMCHFLSAIHISYTLESITSDLFWRQLLTNHVSVAVYMERNLQSTYMCNLPVL